MQPIARFHQMIALDFHIKNNPGKSQKMCHFPVELTLVKRDFVLLLWRNMCSFAVETIGNCIRITFA